eukprot:TRINITY_DN1854_c0_g1_i1.p1 TRINITY_DN1854_c0_g1~~TRINITY_DN1854_c0_g1_i1.p1  ORF type:complete len:1246 (+),score=370.01 TRINITY_DN1854_c0_g1_i1:119-3856(+)
MPLLFSSPPLQPTCDGRGVVVAIFDTGVDPGAAGLHETTTGQRKVIGLVDASGSGDIRLGPAVPLQNEDDSRFVVGCDGKRWTLPADWNVPDGTCRTGSAWLYHMIARGLKSRLQRERKRRHEERIDALLVATQAKVTAAKERDEREDAELQVKELRALKKTYKDIGPKLRVVSFHDGDCIRVAISVSTSFASAQPLTDFHKDTHGTLCGCHEDGYDDKDLYLLNYGVNIYEGGDLVSIVVDAGSHGTHVAGIVAGHYPDQPEYNGIAPGAQIISVKIGDSRLGSMETGQSLTRAMKLVVDLGAHIVNMSYGESSSHPSFGRVMELYSQLVLRHNILFVTSAGNDGPGLSTMGAPATADGLISVGAYVSPEMMQAQYCTPARISEMPYTWSSRGPAQDGANVVIGAPGGAICSIPTWNISKNTQMNGTSMSSPNACGGITLLLSSLMAKGIPYSSYAVQRAIQATARHTNFDRFALGSGLLQVCEANDALVRWAAEEDVSAKLLQSKLRMNVRVSNRKHDRGIYVREKGEFDRGLLTFQLSVKPEALGTEQQVADLHRELVDFEVKMNIRVEYHNEEGRDQLDPPFVTVPAHAVVMYGGRTVTVDVDCSKVEPGRLRYAEICGYCSDFQQEAPLFRVPVTVVHPNQCDERSDGVQTEAYLRNGDLHRSFWEVPRGVSFAELTFSPKNIKHTTTFVCHCLQALPEVSYSDSESKKWIRLAPDSQPFKACFPLHESRTLEVVLGQYWSSAEYNASVSFEIKFRGLKPSSSVLSFSNASLFTRVNVQAFGNQVERCEPSASLTHLRKSIAPSSAAVAVLPADRHAFPDRSHLHELVLSYNFKAAEACEATVRFPLANNALYESVFSGQLQMVFDSNKRLLKASDAVPEKFSLPRAGTYTVRIQLLHHNTSTLDEYKSMPAQVEFKLPSAIALPVHATRGALMASRNTGSFKCVNVHKGMDVAVYVAACAVSALPKGTEVGDLLTGEVFYGKKSASAEESVYRRPSGYPLKMSVCSLAKAPESKASVDHRTEHDKHADAMADKILEFLARLPTESDEQFKEFVAAVDSVPASRSLEALMLKAKKEQERKALDDALASAEQIVAQVDQGALAMYLGKRHADADDSLEGQREKRKMEVCKKALVAALVLKLEIACEREDKEAAATALKQLESWCDADKEKPLACARAKLLEGRTGKAIALLRATHGQKEALENEKGLLRELERACDAAGWSAVKAEYGELLDECAAEFAPF